MVISVLKNIILFLFYLVAFLIETAVYASFVVLLGFFVVVGGYGGVECLLSEGFHAECIGMIIMAFGCLMILQIILGGLLPRWMQFPVSLLEDAIDSYGDHHMARFYAEIGYSEKEIQEQLEKDRKKREC